MKIIDNRALGLGLALAILEAAVGSGTGFARQGAGQGTSPDDLRRAQIANDAQGLLGRVGPWADRESAKAQRRLGQAQQDFDRASAHADRAFEVLTGPMPGDPSQAEVDEVVRQAQKSADDDFAKKFPKVPNHDPRQPAAAPRGSAPVARRPVKARPTVEQSIEARRQQASQQQAQRRAANAEARRNIESATQSALQTYQKAGEITGKAAQHDHSVAGSPASYAQVPQALAAKNKSKGVLSKLKKPFVAAKRILFGGPKKRR